MKQKYTVPGVVVGGVAWVALILFQISQSSCLKSGCCDGTSMFYSSFISVGMLAPAWFVTMLVSDMFGGKEL